MDSEDSEESVGYNSDDIDSETEQRLYAAIHHSMAPEEEQLVTETSVTTTNLVESQPKTTSSKNEESMETNGTESQMNLVSDQPLNNLFRILDDKLDESDAEFCDDFNFNFNNNMTPKPNKRTIDCIDISDSDSDVVIIDDKSFNYKSNSRTVDKQKSPKSKEKRPKALAKPDISFGNVENLKDSSIDEMNQFYNEDDYDSEEEAKSFSRMSGDRSLWEISYNDILLTQNKNNRYYRNRFICNNCNERGHMSRDCPLPKKSPVCFLCGNSGHKSERCRSVLCSKCQSLTHRTSFCKVSVNQLICDECGVGGHVANQCTYNWRKYHLTTTYSSNEPMVYHLRPNERKCCYNCGAIGKHFGFECRLKSIEKHMIPVSPLMPNTRKTHCFNGRQTNNKSNDSNEKDSYNEFVKNISSNQLSHRLSASFNKPLDQFDSIGSSASTSASSCASTSATIDPTFQCKNKHIKWVYPETNGTTRSSYGNDINGKTRIARNSHKNRVIGERTEFERVMSYANSSTAIDSAHTLTPTPTHQQINNSMQEKTQTTPQLNERSKRRKNRRKKRKIVETKGREGELQSFRQPNGSHLKTFDSFRKIKTNNKRFGQKKKLLL